MKSMAMTNKRPPVAGNRGRPLRRSYQGIKRALFVGSVLASLAGARWLEWRDQAAVATTGTKEVVQQQTSDLPVAFAREQHEGDDLQLQLNPIATAVPLQRVRPVARTRSSR